MMKLVGYGMVWYGNFIYTRYFIQVHLHSSACRKLTTYTVTKLEVLKIKTKTIKMKIKHLLSKEAVCKNNILLIFIISHRN